MCVRITDMRGVDLRLLPFDFDLTFSMLLMDAERGHVYHRFGGRDERGPDTWLSLAALESVLRATLREAAEPLEAKPPPETRSPLMIEDVAAFARRDRGECIHCHSIFPALYEDSRQRGTWREQDRWVHPSPRKLGLDLDRDDQTLVTSVSPGSPAARGGLEVGDRLRHLSGLSIASASDVMYALHRLPAGDGELEVGYLRGGGRREAVLELAPGWKESSPLEYSWRAFKWGFTPAPGFGGKQLGARELRELGLEEGAFAFRVDYFVTWGDNRRYGVEAGRAGLRRNDVFLAASGKSDFASVDHFHAWWRLTREVGSRVPVVVLREGRRRVFELRVLE